MDKPVCEQAIDVRPHPQVLVGRDGQLFLTGDAHDVIAQVEGRHPITDLEIDSIAMLHSERSSYCSLLGVPYCHIVAPNKELYFNTSCLTAFVPADSG